MFEKQDSAPEFTFNEDRVREPDAGIPEKIEQPMLESPIARVSRSVSIRLPNLADNDFPMERPSSRQRRAIAKDDQSIVCQWWLNPLWEGRLRNAQLLSNESK